MDFKIDAKGVTPIPARFSAWTWTHQEDLPPTRRIVSNLAKSSDADPNGLDSEWMVVSMGQRVSPVDHDSRQDLILSLVHGKQSDSADLVYRSRHLLLLLPIYIRPNSFSECLPISPQFPHQNAKKNLQ